MKCHPIFILLLLAGCGESEPASATPTESVCPDDSAFDYENFGQAFVSQYCLDCHSRSVAAADRQGAPSDHNFDTLNDVREMMEHIDSNAAAGPSGVNEIMPPVEADAVPSDEERRRLGEWIACGAP